MKQQLQQQQWNGIKGSRDRQRERERHGRSDRYSGRTSGDKRAKGVLLLIMRRGQVEVGSGKGRINVENRVE